MGVAEDWDLEKALRSQRAALSGPLLGPCFRLWVGKARTAPFLHLGSSPAYLRVGSSDREGGGARPPDLRASARLRSGLSATAAGWPEKLAMRDRGGGGEP